MWLLYASEISGAIGKHKYKKKWEVLLQVWKRVSPKTFSDACERNKIKTTTEIVQDLIENIDAFKTAVDKISECKTQHVHASNTVDIVNESLKEKEKELKQEKKKLQEKLSTLPKTDETKINAVKVEIEQAQKSIEAFEVGRKELLSSVKTEHGEREEKTMIDAELIGKITENNSKFYSLECGENPVKWGIGGRIDGFRNGTLIEIKNRVNKIFDPLPEYDYIQVQCYMQLVDKPNAIVVQRLTNELKKQIHEIFVLRDSELWKNEIKLNLQAFVNLLFALTQDVTLQDKLLKAPDSSKSRVVNSMLKKF